MTYSHCFFYVLDKEDEIIRFNEKEHCVFDFDTRLPFAEEIKLNPKELIITNFFYHYACEAWKDGEHYPDHSVCMIITNEELSKLLHMKVEDVKSSIIHLLEKDVIGIVLLPDNKYAYHFVL